jgi:hypothetical protein
MNNSKNQLFSKVFLNEFSSESGIENLTITLSEEDVKNIKEAQEILKNNNFISQLRLKIIGDVVYKDDEDEIVTDYEIDIQEFIVNKDSFCYYSQNKWSSFNYIVSEDLNLI